MTPHDFFMEAANRYRGGHAKSPENGVGSWGDILEVAKAISEGDADPFNNIYLDEERFDIAPRPSARAQRAYSDNEYASFLSCTQDINYGAQMLIRLNRPGSFLSPEQVQRRVRDTQAVGAVLSLFIAAATELTDSINKPMELADGLKFTARYEDKVRRLYRRNREALHRLDPTLDAIVDFVNREHIKVTGKPLLVPFRNAIRSFAHIGRLAVRGNGNGHKNHG